MDKIIIQNLKCQKHQNKDLQFFQISDVSNQQQISKPLFYCSSCFNHDLQFKSINYLMIDQILQEADKTIIPKWPPVNDYQIISDLIDITSNQSQLDYVKQITDFFNKLKEEILSKIDIIQKKMINEALKYPIDSSQIIKRYQEISSICQFKQLLSNQQVNSIQDHSIICREFISKMESQKDKNTELLQELLSQTSQLQTNFNLEYPNSIKQHLFNFIDQICFFKQDLNQNNSVIEQTNSINQSNNTNFKISADLIMKLASNKTNFCTDQFLIELNQNLQRVSPLFQNSTFRTIYKENKELLDFSKISQEKLNQIEDDVKHQILLASDSEYEKQMKNSLEIQKFKEILNSKFNFLSKQFAEEFEKYLIDIQPYLSQLNLSNAISDQNKYNFFRNLLDDQEYDAFYNYHKKRLFYNNLSFHGTKFKNGLDDCLVNKNKYGEIEIQRLNKSCDINCISNAILKKDLKYIFRLQVESISEGNHFLIGLMRSSNAESSGGHGEKLSYMLKSQDQAIKKSVNYCIFQQIKGDSFMLSQEKMVEIRVYLREQMLEVTDYPNYQYIIGVEDQYKSKLTQYGDLIFYLNPFNQGIKIILKDAKIVNEFENN
ncbi:hypothetical protein ABPG72_019007 [Tetrahymena utriculariae]